MLSIHMNKVRPLTRTFWPRTEGVLKRGFNCTAEMYVSGRKFAKLRVLTKSKVGKNAAVENRTVLSYLS